MYLKTMKPTYYGEDITGKISMLISYVEELGEEISYRLETLSQAVDNIKRDLYLRGGDTDESI